MFRRVLNYDNDYGGSLDSRDPIGHTVGFEPSIIQHSYSLSQNPWCKERYRLTIYDVGGGPKIRGIWNNYLAEAHGLIYVIRSDSSPEKLTEAIYELEKLLDPAAKINALGKPILVLVNRIQPSQEGTTDTLVSKLLQQGIGPVYTNWPSLEDHQKPGIVLLKEVQCRGNFSMAAKQPRGNKVGPTTTETGKLPKAAGIDPSILEAIDCLIRQTQLHREDIEAKIRIDLKVQAELHMKDLEEKRQRMEEFKQKSVTLKQAEMLEDSS